MSPETQTAVLIAISVAINQTSTYAASHGVPVYAQAFASTKLYCLATEVHWCEQLAKGCYSTAHRPGMTTASLV